MMGSDLRVVDVESEVATVDHGVLENVRMATSAWNPVWREIRDFFESPNTVRVKVH